MNVEENPNGSTSRFMLMVSFPYAPLVVVSASFILSPNYNAILLFLMFRCFVIDFIVSIRSAGIDVHFTCFIETCPV